MGKRNDKRKFQGDEETMQIHRVVVCGGKVLMHKEQWQAKVQRHRKKLAQKIKALKDLLVLDEEQDKQLEQLRGDLTSVPSDQEIEAMPTQEQLRSRITDMAQRATMMMVVFSRILCYHVHRCLAQGLKLPEMNQAGLQFLRQICTTGGKDKTKEKTKKKFPEFVKSVDQFFNHFPASAQELKNVDVEGLGTTINYEMKKHAVAISNHLVYNFEKRCRQWAAFRLNQLAPNTSRKDRSKMIDTIIGRLLDNEEEQNYGEYQPPPFEPTDEQEAFMDIIWGELGGLFPEDSDGNEVMFPVTIDWLKDQNNWQQLLTFYDRLNQLFGQHNQRRFDLLPLCSFRTRCITLDHGIFCQLFGVPVKQRDNTPWSRFLWLSHVHLDEHPGLYKCVPTSVQTDGVRFIVLSEKSVPKRSKQANIKNAATSESDDLDQEVEEPAVKKQKLPERRIFDQLAGIIKMTNVESLGTEDYEIIGIDPGVTDMFAVVDEWNNYSRLTRKQYNKLVGISGDRKQLQRWKDKEGISALENSIAPSCASSMREFEQHIRTFFAVAQRLHQFYGAKRITRMRFKHYIRRDKLLDRFINKAILKLDSKDPFSRRPQGIGKQSTIQKQLVKDFPKQAGSSSPKKVIAFGAASFNKALRGWSGVPGKRMCYRLQQRAPVMLVDEYLTSQVSNVTLERQTNLFRKKKMLNKELSTEDNPVYETKDTLIWGLKAHKELDRQGHKVTRYADRNRNAAINIRDLGLYWLKHHDRPAQFKRGQNVAIGPNLVSAVQKHFL